MRSGLAPVVATAVAARAAAVAWASEPGLRFDKFLLLADRLRSGGWIPSEPFAYSPAYTYFVAAVRRLTGGSELVLASLQAAIGCVAVVAVWSLTRRAFGPRSAFVAGIGAALAVPLVQYSVAFESDGLGVALLLCAAAAAATAVDGCRWRWFWAAGLLLGVRACQRPNGLVAAAAVIAVVAVARWTGKRRRRVGALVIIAVGTAMPLAAVTALGGWRSGQLSPVMTSSGWVLYTSHNHTATGLGYAPPPLALELKRDPRLDPVERMDDAVSETIAAWVVGRPVTAAEASRFWRGEAARCVSDRGLADLVLSELHRAWFAIHSYDAQDNPALVAQAARMRGWPLLGAGVLVPLGLAGLGRRLVTRPRLGPAGLLAAALLVVPAVTMALFYVVARFRLELVALLLPFAGWGLVDLVGSGRRRPTAADAVWAVTLAAALVAAWLPGEQLATHRRRAVIRLETVRGALATDPAAAAFHFRRAARTARYPAEAATAERRLAALLPALGKPDEARRAAAHAAGLLLPDELEGLRSRRDDPDALWAIGRHRFLVGDTAGAVDAFEDAHDAAPFDAAISLSLAVALDAGAEPGSAAVRDLAIEALRHGARFSSDAPRAWRLIARHESGLDRPEAAAAAAAEASRLETTLPTAPRSASSR